MIAKAAEELEQLFTWENESSDRNGTDALAVMRHRVTTQTPRLSKECLLDLDHGIKPDDRKRYGHDFGPIDASRTHVSKSRVGDIGHGHATAVRQSWGRRRRQIRSSDAGPDSEKTERFQHRFGVLADASNQSYPWLYPIQNLWLSICIHSSSKPNFVTFVIIHVYPLKT